MSLSEKTCVACKGDIPPLQKTAAENLLAQTPDWSLIDNATKIKRTFKFKNFKDAVSFINKVGEIAESEGHHPDITFGWGYATIIFFTHKIKGLHENDFIMASKADTIFNSTN